MTDSEDRQHGSNVSQQANAELRKLSRPYLISAGIENGIRYVFTMNPLMSKVLSKAEFIEADITFVIGSEKRAHFAQIMIVRYSAI